MKKTSYVAKNKTIFMLLSLFIISFGQFIQVLGEQVSQHENKNINAFTLNNISMGISTFRPVGMKYPMGNFKYTMPLNSLSGKAIQSNLSASPTTIATDEFDDIVKEFGDISNQDNLKIDVKNPIHKDQLHEEVVFDDSTGLTMHTIFDAQNNIIFEVIYDKQKNKIFEVIHEHDKNAIVERFYVNNQLESEVLGLYSPDKNLIQEIKYDAHHNKISETLYNSDHSYTVKIYNNLDSSSEEQHYDASDNMIRKIVYNHLGDKNSETIYNNDGSYINTIYTGQGNPYFETKYNVDNQIVNKISYNGKGKKIDEMTYNADGSSTQSLYGKNSKTKNYNVEQTKILAQLELANLSPQSQGMIVKIIEKNPKFNEDIDLNNMVNSIMNAGNKLTSQQIASMNKEIMDPYSSLTNKQKNNFIKALIIYQPLSDAQANLAKIAVRKTSDNAILASIMNGIVSGKVTDEKGIDTIISM